MSVLNQNYKGQLHNHHRTFVSYDDLSTATNDGYITVAPPLKTIQCSSMNYSWTLSEAVEKSCWKSTANKVPPPKLPLVSFNHVSREVLDLEKSKQFYIDILGFEEIPRPPFDSEGCWLAGYGLNLHIICTRVPQVRKKVKQARIQHFSAALPAVDHIAFITHDLSIILDILNRNNVYYKYENLEAADIQQVFFFDPDGNVIEVSNCVPTKGKLSCRDEDDSEQATTVNTVATAQDDDDDNISIGLETLDDDQNCSRQHSITDDCRSTVSMDSK